MLRHIRPTLYIGLGGAGIKTILHTKKQFIDTYGEVPPMIGFLGIDTDVNEFSTSLKLANGDHVMLHANETLLLNMDVTEEYLKAHKEEFSWIPQENVNSIPSLTHRAIETGGIRSNGRFAFIVNRDKILNIIRLKLNNIVNINNLQLTHITNIDVNIISSLCGGTGSGIFVDIAYLLQDIEQYISIRRYGYAILPDIFNTSPMFHLLKANSYASLMELDYLMSHMKDYPFYDVTLVDNSDNKLGYIEDIHKLAEKLSHALLTSVGDINLNKRPIEETMQRLNDSYIFDIRDHRAWVKSIGSCEIVYDTDTIAEIYQSKAAICIIDRLLYYYMGDVNHIANSWIDSSDVYIRENNDCQHVTDYIGSKEPPFPLIFSNYYDPDREVRDNINCNEMSNSEISEKIDTLIERVRTQLRILLVKHINQKGGIQLALDIINTIRLHISLSLNNITYDKEILKTEQSQLYTYIETATIEFKRYICKIFKFKNGIERRAADVADVVHQYNSCVRDIQRHDAAITAYKGIINLLNKSEAKVIEIEKMVKEVKQNLQHKVEELQMSHANYRSIYQINITEDDVKSVRVKDSDFSIEEFIYSLDGNSKVFDWDQCSYTDIERVILNFTKTLRAYHAHKEQTIDDALRNLCEEDLHNRVEYALTLAGRKSIPMLCYDYRGQRPNNKPLDSTYIGVLDRNTSILNNKDDMVNYCPYQPFDNTQISYVSLGIKDKIIIYRELGYLPAYTIKNIESYKQEYETYQGKPYSYHFDAEIYRRMQQDKHQLLLSEEEINNIK